MENQTKIILVIVLIVFIINGIILIWYMNKDSYEDFSEEKESLWNRILRALEDNVFISDREMIEGDTYVCEHYEQQVTDGLTIEDAPSLTSIPMMKGLICINENDLDFKVYCEETDLKPDDVLDSRRDIQNVTANTYREDISSKTSEVKINFIDGKDYESYYIYTEDSKINYLCKEWGSRTKEFSLSEVIK